jgi:hypothetical protein
MPDYEMVPDGEEAEETQADRDAQAVPYTAHLIYEVEALVRITTWLQVLGDEEGPPMLWAACLEACLVHARLLIEFLVGRRRGRMDSDFGANDLLPEWDAHVSDGKLDAEALWEFLDRLDKTLAHLSKDRVAEDDRPDTWALDGVNLVFRSVKVFALALTDAESQVSEPLIYALQSYESTVPVRPPT